MRKSAKTRQQDEALAHELGLRVSPFTVTLKHTMKLTTLVEGFVFSYVKDSVVYFDTAPTWREVLGLRCKKRKFAATPQTLNRLRERVYNRWYFKTDNQLIPVQMAKYSDMLDHFYFIEGPNPLMSTQTVSPVQETMALRKKPLLAMRKRTSWGDPIEHAPLVETA